MKPFTSSTKHAFTELYGLPGLISASGAAMGSALLQFSFHPLFLLLCAALSLILPMKLRICLITPFLICAMGLTHSRIPAPISLDAPKLQWITGKIQKVDFKQSKVQIVVQSHPWGNLQLQLANDSNPQNLAIGQQIWAQVMLMPHARSYQIPGSFQERVWLKRLKIQGKGHLLQYDIIDQSTSIQNIIKKIQNKIKSLCSRFLKPNSSGILVALLIGDRTELNPETVQDFRKSGMIHVLAVSGFHVVLIANLLQLIFQALRLSRTKQRFASCFFLLIYIPIVGASPSVVRAVLMFLAEQFSSELERKPASLHRLGFAMTVILLIDPNSLWDLGFQLSCGATAGIIIAQRYSPDLKNLARPLQFIASSLWITLGATCGTVPILIHCFQGFSPIAWIGNLCVVPLIALAMQSGIFMLTFSSIPWIACAFGESAHFLISISLVLVSKLSQSPGATLSLGPWPIGITLILIPCTLCLPIALKTMTYRAWLLPSLSLACLGIYFTYSTYEDQVQSKVELYFLDADQGDCTLIRFPNQQVILIDAGNTSRQGQYGAKQIAPFLHRLGIHEIHSLVITHPDADHYGGAASLLDAMTVQNVWIARATRYCDKQSWLDFINKASSLKINLDDLHASHKIQGPGDWSLDVLYPFSNHQNTMVQDWNSISIALQLKSKTQGVALFTGDLGIQEEHAMELIYAHKLGSRILKMGHHGSKTSSSLSWLNRVQPSIAMISAGYKNRYGHPSSEILLRLDTLKIPKLITSEHGTIRIQIPAKNLIPRPMIWNGKEWKLAL